MSSVNKKPNIKHYYINKFFFENIRNEIKKKEMGTSIQRFKSKLNGGVKIYEKSVEDKNIETSKYELEEYFLIEDMKEALENNEPNSVEIKSQIEKILDVLNKEKLSKNEWEYLETFTEKMNKYYLDKTESSILFLNTYPK